MRRRYAVLLAAVAAGLAAYVGFWFWAADAVEQGVLRWAEQRRAEGAEVGWRSLAVGGFPFRIRLSFEEPRLALPAHPLAPEWRGLRLVAVTHPWRLGHVLASFEGAQSFGFADNGRRRGIELRTQSWLASWQGGGPASRRVSFDLKQVEAVDTAASEPTRAARLQVHARPGQSPSALADVAFKAEGVRLPQAADLPLGQEIALIELDAAAMGPAPSGDYPEALLRWRDEGGVIEVRRAALDWADVRFETSGTLALDAQTRPEGAFTARIWNHRRLLEELVAAKAMAEDDARLARAALDLLAAANKGMLSAPLTLQNGRVWLGPVAVARLRPLFPDAVRNPAPESPAPRR